FLRQDTSPYDTSERSAEHHQYQLPRLVQTTEPEPHLLREQERIEMSVSAAKKMIKARANLVMAHPFFGTLALRLKMVEDPNVKTASCDGQTLRHNPKFVDSMSQSKVQGLIAHEGMHHALLHHPRRSNR